MKIAGPASDSERLGHVEVDPGQMREHRRGAGVQQRDGHGDGDERMSQNVPAGLGVLQPRRFVASAQQREIDAGPGHLQPVAHRELLGVHVQLGIGQICTHVGRPVDLHGGLARRLALAFLFARPHETPLPSDGGREVRLLAPLQPLRHRRLLTNARYESLTSRVP